MEKQKKTDEINILDHLILIAKYKKLIIKVTLSIAVITAIISLIMTPTYKAETRIVPPKQSNFVVSQLARRFGGNIANLAGSMLGTQFRSRLYIGIIKSRTVLDSIIDRFELMKRYKAKYKKKARKRLRNLISVKYNEESGMIIITVKDKDPKIAADIANAFIEELRNLLKDMAFSEASIRRVFFEEHLKQVTEDLIKSEEALKEFQEKTGILNPDPLMPSVRIPAVATEFIRKMRDLKYNEKLFEIMAEQYEIARVDEARDPSIIQVVDKAIPPERRAWPKRTLMVIVAAFMGFFFSLFIIFTREYFKRQFEGKEDRDKIETLKEHLSLKRKI